MPDSVVRGTIQIVGGAAARAELLAYKAALMDISSASAKTTLAVDTSALSRVKSDVASLGSAHQALSAKSASLGVDYSQITSARSAVQGLDGDVTSLATSLSKLSAPVALAAIGVGVTKLAEDFQTTTTRIRNNTTETAADFAAMNATIKALAVEGGASLDSLGTGFAHAFNLTDSAASATNDLTIAMKSAVSTGSDVSATTDALAKTMHQFGIANSEAAVTMDELHASAALGNTTLEQFIGASAKAMVTAASLGVSLQDVSSAYVGLTRSGFDAGEANTQIAALLTHLIKPSLEAKAAIADLAKTTGIDLTNDFSLAGVQAKGLTGVLTDIRNATNGQEDAVLKLIPAQRGGIGALALTTTAYKDVLDAGSQLARVQSGEWTPTADAYALTQQTLGYKTAVLGQQLKQLGIDAGGATIGPISALLGVISSIPQGVDKAVIGFGLAGLAIKTVSVASDLLVTGTARVGAAMAAETATVTADTAAWTANAAARNAASGISGVEGYAARSAAAQTGVDAVGLAGYEARTAAQTEAGLASKLSGGIAGLGAGIGTAALPVAIPLAVTFSVGKFIVEPWQNAVRDEATKLEQTKVEMTIQTTVRYAQSADSRTQGRADLQAQLAEAQSIQKEFEGLAASGVGGDQAQKAVEFFKAQQAEISKALTDTSPEHYASQATDEFSKHLADLSSAVENNRLTLDQATKFADAYRQEAIDTGAGVDQATAAEKGWTTAIKDRQNAAYQAQYIELQTLQAERDRAKDLLDKGAPPALVETAVFGKGLGVDPAVLVQQEAELKKWEGDYKTTQEANKKAAADSAATQKAEIQSVADTQIAAAKASADAWKDAASEVSKLDIGKSGLQSLIDAAPGLDRVQLALAQLGTGDAALDNLTNIAKKFADISDAEKAASASYRGYLLTLDETDKRVTAIDALKKRLLDAVDAAQQAKLRGTATSQQEQLVAGAPGAFAQLNQAEVQLKGNGAQDWAGIIQNLPEWLRGQLQADSSTRAAVGDGKQLLLTVEADKTKAAADLDAFEKEDRKAVVKITADTKDAIASIDALIAHMPTSIPLLITTPPGGINPARGYGDDSGGVGYGQYRPLDQPSYTAIVREGAGGKTSPFEDPAVYASVLKAAQEYGVDPRALLAFTKGENSNATNISPTLVAAHNYGGIKYVGQEGASQGPMSPEGDNYASFPNADAFFRALAANISTGIYEGYAKSGDIRSAAQTYITGGGPGTAAQQVAITNRVQDYQNYVQQYPATGTGAPITRGTGYGPGDTALGSSQTPTGGSVPDAVVGSVRDQIVQKALQSVGQDKLVDYCEQFVEETVQAITRKRGATGTNEGSATLAFQHAQAAGLERPANQAPQAGDLVYYPDANGGPGHVAVYAGKGQQISTWDKGDPTGVNRQIHVEAISPGARFIEVPGTQSDTTRTSGAAGSGIPGQANVSGTGVSAQSTEELERGVYHVYEKAALLKQTMSTLTPKDFSATISQFNTLGPVLDRLAHAGDTELTSTTTKAEETASALAKNVDLTNLWGQGLAAITNKSGDLATIQQKIASTISGPVSAALNAELSALSDQAAIAERINTLTARKASLEAAITATATARQAEDTAESRNQTRQSWADQDVDTGLANRGRVENTRFTGVSRTEEDRSRQLAFEQQVQATELQNKLTDLQKSQTQTGYQRTSQEQLLERSAAGAGTNQQQGLLSARLAAMHEQDTLQKDANTREIDAIQLKIREQAKAANLDSYNLETERIAEQRKHEDILQGITDEGVANTATRQARDRAHQQDLWNIQDERTKEDAKNTARIAAIDAEITAQQALATTADANLKAAQDALAIYTQTGIDIGLAGTALDNAALKLINAAQQAAYYASVSGLSTSTGVPYSQFPHPGASHATGGYVSGGGIVGDSASGDMSTAEYVEGNYRVYPHDSPVTQRALQGTRHYAGGTVAPIRQSSDGGGISVSFNIGAINMGADEDEDTFIARVNRVTDPKLRALYREMKQSKRSHNRANGITPMGG